MHVFGLVLWWLQIPFALRAESTNFLPNKSFTASFEALARRTYFYVGGHYENISHVSFTKIQVDQFVDVDPLLGPGQVMIDQIYVEKLTPLHVTHKFPIVFWAGRGQTGDNFLNTPDGRQGLASYFLDRGYVVFLTDQPQRGRSPWIPGQGTLEATTVDYVQKFFTTVERFNLWPQAILHTQWPGTGVPGDPIFDAFFATQVQFQANASLSELNNRAAGIALLDRIGPAILITHSQAGPYGWGIGDLRPSLVKGILAVEPQGPPFVDEIISSGSARPYGISTLPLTYSPPVTHPATDLEHVTIPPRASNLSACIQQGTPTRKLVHLSKFPVLVLTSEASYHATYDYCTVNYLRQAGVDALWVNLPAVGIRGNGHFSFLEKNNRPIFAIMEKWVSEAERTGLSTLT